MAKKKTEFVNIGDVKDWRNAGYEIEVLGHRLDKARTALKRCKPETWAYNYWHTTEQRILTKWKLTIQLKDTGLKQITEKRVDTARYDWWEKSEEIGGIGFITWFDDFINNIGLQQRLGESWGRALEEKVQKARKGLA